MMRAPSPAAISLAEQHLAHSKREVRASAARLRSALRATLARPTTLAGVAGTAGIAGFLLARRSKQRPVPVRVEQTSAAEAPSTATTAVTAAAASTSIVGIIVAFAMRYAMQHLPQIAYGMWKARIQGGGVQPGVGTPRYPPPRYRSTGTPH